MFRVPAARTLIKWLTLVLCTTAMVQMIKVPRNPGTARPLRTSVSSVVLEKPRLSEECECRDSSNKAFDFCYRLPSQPVDHGKRFNCRHMDIMKELGLLENKFMELSTEKFPDPVFVTAFSSNHAVEGKRMLKIIRQFWPEQKVVLYDLGLEHHAEFFKTACNVEVRAFNFTRYPAYFKRLNEFRWKPVVIAETLKEFGAIFYMDSSIVFKKSDLSHVFELVKCRTQVTKRPPLLSVEERDRRENETTHESGWNKTQWRENIAECRKSAYLLHGYTGHGIYPATHPGVYDFIPTNFTEIRKPKAKMYEAGLIYAVRTQDAVENILKWYVLCALEEDCMAPQGSSSACYFKENDRFEQYAQCHRFDQSIVNLLAANSFFYDRHYYVSEIVDFFDVVRAAFDDVPAALVRCK